MTLITTYNPVPINFTYGQGIWLYDEKGNAYLDTTSGIAVCGLGHAHPQITATIQQQAAKLLHVSNAFQIREQELLAEKLIALTKMEQAFFGNSGAEANESAIKLTRLYGHQLGIAQPQVIVLTGAFHGRTMATLTASARKVQVGFEPLVPGFLHLPFNDLNAIKAVAANRKDIVAIMLEPIQGEGGVNVADSAYLYELAALCQERDWLYIWDEIQTGNGRTGKLYDYMHYAIQPDILTTAKGLGNGMPISVCLMRGKACNLFKPGNHGSTFGGNPLACATALQVLEIIERDKLCEQVSRNSIILQGKLRQALEGQEGIVNIRGKGYILGIELAKPASQIKTLGLANGILINVTNETVIRLLPPLIITAQEIDELVNRLTKTIEQFC